MTRTPNPNINSILLYLWAIKAMTRNKEESNFYLLICNQKANRLLLIPLNPREQDLNLYNTGRNSTFYQLNYRVFFYVGAIRTLNSKYQKFMTYLLVDNILVIGDKTWTCIVLHYSVLSGTCLPIPAHLLFIIPIHLF